MQDWIPVPGTAKARLVEAAIHQFEMAGYEAVNVTELAGEGRRHHGALYHHFDSKLGLYLVVREEMERRVVDRMAGAVAAAGGRGRAAVRAALLVAFDAAVHFGVCRILAEPLPVQRDDPVEATLRPLLPQRTVRPARSWRRPGERHCWRSRTACRARPRAPRWSGC